MNLLSAEQIKQADQHTILNEPVSSIDLMERAALACCDFIYEKLPNQKSFAVVCGTGNNGGDGLAMARLLAGRGYSVRVFIVGETEKYSTDFKINLNRLSGISNVIVNHIDSINALSFLKNELIVDALFGIGLSRPLDGLNAEVVEKINASGKKIVSVDMPSGLPVDTAFDPKKFTIVKANYTLTFQRLKLNFLFPESYPYTGEISVLDIHLDESFMDTLPSKNHLVSRKDILAVLKLRSKFSHKGTYGHAILFAGSLGKVGAAVLSARAALSSGLGLLTVHLPKCGYTVMQGTVPEAMVSMDETENFISSFPKTFNYDAVGFGPGLGTDVQTASVLKVLLQQHGGPLCIDADGLNILSENKTWLAFMPSETILTPHPKEFDRLAGAHSDSFSRLESAKAFALRFNCIVVLKGTYTATVLPDGNVFFNSTGNAGLAKGGSGDVLTGIITGLLARGYTPTHAAVLGNYLHGMAADLCAEQESKESILASDVITQLGQAFLKLENEIRN